jgi:hypothetical protein
VCAFYVSGVCVRACALYVGVIGCWYKGSRLGIGVYLKRRGIEQEALEGDQVKYESTDGTRKEVIR